MSATGDLVQQAQESTDRIQRREAFIALISSDDWERGMILDVLDQQGYTLRDGFHPDLHTARAVAPEIASSEDKLHRALELIHCRFCTLLLEVLAPQMGAELVDHVLDHLRTAQGERAHTLIQILGLADPRWVARRAARRIISKLLSSDNQIRAPLMLVLAEADSMSPFGELIRKHPPTSLEEWGAMGKTGQRDDELVDLALASFRHSPEALAYLLQLDPIPDRVGPLMMAAAKPDWLVEAMEVAVLQQLDSPRLLPLAELGVRLGGQSMAVAGAWLGSVGLSKKLLSCLADQIKREDGRDRVDNMLWVNRNAPSADRALEQGRAGIPPEPLDAAALVRQLLEEDGVHLARQILSEPLEAMIQPVLRPLCTVNAAAAQEVVTLSKSTDPAVAQRAKQALTWPDVFWE